MLFLNEIFIDLQHAYIQQQHGGHKTDKAPHLTGLADK